MTTMFDPTRPDNWDMPVDVELWSTDGTRLGYLGQFETMTFTFAERSAHTAEIEAPLNDLTAMLVPCDGTVLVGMRYGGRTHLTMPVKASVVSGQIPELAMVKVATAGGWSLLDGQRIPPSLLAPLIEQTGTEFELSGRLETVVKTLLRVGLSRMDHPLVIALDQRRGPIVNVSGAWETVGETIASLLVKTGWRLDLDGWLPGDAQPIEDVTLRTPTFVAEVYPYRKRAGLVWSVDSGDITDWEITHTRASITQGTVGYSTDKQEQRRYMDVDADTVSIGKDWNGRDGYTEYSDHKEIDDRDPDPIRVTEGMQAAGAAMLNEHGESIEMNVTVDTSNLWSFHKDDTRPRSFDIGDYAEVRLPVLGAYTQVITEVTLELTPAAFTVTPKVSTPDTMGTDMYSTIARLDKRVNSLETKG